MSIRLVNTELFRESALHFDKHGYYCDAPTGTRDWEEYWDREWDRCRNGYSVGGAKITGLHYFYLNYSRMELVSEAEAFSKGVDRVWAFPHFWDGDYNFFWSLDIAKNGISEEELAKLGLDVVPVDLDGGHHMVVLKARGKGYSYKSGAILAHSAYFYRGTKNFAIANEWEYLTSDGLLNKTWNVINHLDDHTAWAQPKLRDTTEHKRLGYRVMEMGMEIERGSKSEIMGISCKDDPDKARGKRGRFLLFEEAGKFPGLLKAWQVARPSVEQGRFTFGTMVAYGTGGTEEANYESLEELFYNPEGYNVQPFENIWDDGGSGTKCGFFVPAYQNYQGFIDKDGNSDNEAAKQYLQEKRDLIKKNAKTASALEQAICEDPFCLQGDTWVSWENGIDRIKNNPRRIENGVADLYRMVTENGRELICTETHPIFDGKEYRDLRDYEVGDRVKILPITFNETYQSVQVPHRVGALTTEFVLDEDWGRFIGFFLGDGSFYKNTVEITFDRQDESSIAWVMDFMRRRLCTPYLQSLSNGSTGGCRVRCRDKSLNDLFKALDLLEATEKNLKRKLAVPDVIVKSPRSVVAAFLSGYFDADGSISQKTYNISITSRYERLTQDVLLLLSGFEIYPRYTKRNYVNSFGNDYTDRRLGLRKRDLLIFRDEIRFVSDRKNKILDSYSPSRAFARTDYSYEKIVSIEYYGREEVFNLTTDQHYYSANGIWNHNSPREATLQAAGNLFPTKELVDHLNQITIKKRYNALTAGVFNYDEGGKVVFKPSTDVKPIWDYPVRKGDDTDGAVWVLETPFRDTSGNVPYGLYTICHDPYAHDRKIEGSSLGSAYVIKRTNSFSPTHPEGIVAGYVGRPSSLDEYNHNLFMLAEYYNCKIGYEANRGEAVLGYAKRFKKLHLLEEEPQLVDKRDTFRRGPRPFGLTMTRERIDMAQKYLADWLLEPIRNYEDGSVLLRLHTILDPALIQELIKYDPDPNKNFDRVSALFVGMYYLKDKEARQRVIQEEKPVYAEFFEREHFQGGGFSSFY